MATAEKTFVCGKCGKVKTVTAERFAEVYAGQDRCLVCREWETPNARQK